MGAPPVSGASAVAAVPGSRFKVQGLGGVRNIEIRSKLAAAPSGTWPAIGTILYEQAESSSTASSFVRESGAELDAILAAAMISSAGSLLKSKALIKGANKG
jgi:hypothetical protein